jgi:TolB-like protein/DNA-binding winged helix-turn-helix (wHTH) protein/Tfp pilus assembly protein PilF
MLEKKRSAEVDLGRLFRLGDCSIDPITGEVSDGSQIVRLQPQGVEVLCYLAAHAGEVVSRQDIEDAVWSDRTVGYDALTATMFKLRKALGDDPRSPKIIETISKRGYRLLVAPEQTDVPTSWVGTPKRMEDRAEQSTLPNRRSYVAALVILGLLIVGLAYVSSDHWSTRQAGNAIRPDVQPVPAIAVLPFENLGGANDDVYLASGLTEDLTTALAKVPGLTVIARDSASLYKNEAISLTKLGQALKVGYVLRGSVRQRAGRIRVNAQLVEVATGKHKWVEQLDGPLADMFDLEGQIVDKLTTALLHRPPATPIREGLLAHTVSPKAYRAFQLGRQHFYLYLNKTENAKARTLFETALQHDREFAMALAMLAWTHAFDVMNGWAADRSASLQRANDLARKALQLSPGLPLAYFITGLVHREHGDYIKAMVDAEKAIASDPNYANAHVLLATLLYYAGRPEESVDRLKRAIRLNPHHPYNYSFHLGQAYFTLKRYNEAIASLQRAVLSNPAAERLHVWLAASFAQAGKLDDAEWEAEQVKVLNPQFSIAAIQKSYPFKDIADRQRFLEGLRKAGLI